MIGYYQNILCSPKLQIISTQIKKKERVKKKNSIVKELRYFTLYYILLSENRNSLEKKKNIIVHEI